MRADTPVAIGAAAAAALSFADGGWLATAALIALALLTTLGLAAFAVWGGRRRCVRVADGMDSALLQAGARGSRAPGMATRYAGQAADRKQEESGMSERYDDRDEFDDDDLCEVCGGDGYIMACDGDGGDWGEDTYSGPMDAVIKCRHCNGGKP